MMDFNTKKLHEKNMAYISKYLDDLNKTILLVDEDEIGLVLDVIENARSEHNTIFTMGNGGSGSTASHFVNGLSQGATVKDRPRFKAVALTDNLPNILAYGNDLGYEHIFTEQLRNLLEPGDIVIGISGSGNSKNVINATQYAKNHEATTVGITGFNGGNLKNIVDYSIHVPCDLMEMVEDIHLAITHLIASYFRNAP